MDQVEFERVASTFVLSNAPADTPLLTLAQVGAKRWPIETEFQVEKNETGLDEYEVRSWQSNEAVPASACAGRRNRLELRVD